MFKLEINGAFRGHFRSAADAMEAVDKWARPFRHPWVIYDKFGKIYAES